MENHLSQSHMNPDSVWQASYEALKTTTQQTCNEHALRLFETTDAKLQDIHDQLEVLTKQKSETYKEKQARIAVKNHIKSKLPQLEVIEERLRGIKDR